PKTLAGIIALSTYLPLAKKLEQESDIANHATTIFMAHGEFDPVISLEFAEISRHALTTLDYDVDWHLYPMEHNVCAEEVIALRNWLLARIK
ncbi:MAG: carboxylesterase, partial [Gammaproteobacteria bacterium]|nr:carboxylesterase [Gammaproteobacteria bacterium]